jgi:glycosyltransferase involved in cell wall biosynthesis
MSGGPRACFVSALGPARDVRTFHLQARSLARAGWDVTVIGRDPGPRAVVDGVRIVPLPARRGLGRGLLQAQALRLALAVRADVTQVGEVELLPTALVLKRTARPVVYDCREDYPAYMRQKAWLPRRIRPAVAFAVDRLERLAARRLDAIITADEGTASRLRRHGGRIAVVHNFPRRDWITPAAADAPRAHDVLYHGSLPPYHLAELATVARLLARRMPSARWTIVGDPDSAPARDAFVREVAAAGLAHRVALRPRVAFTDVPALLRAARTAVVPLPDLAKFRRNLPMKLFEYMAAGVPAVASDLPPIRALLGDSGGAVLVPPGDHGAFADALAGLLRDPAAAAAQARRGRAVMEARLTWEHEEPRLVRLYAALLCGPGLQAAAPETLA